MWIRSQNRESLLNVKDLCIYELNCEEKNISLDVLYLAKIITF